MIITEEDIILGCPEEYPSEFTSWMEKMNSYDEFTKLFKSLEGIYNSGIFQRLHCFFNIKRFKTKKLLEIYVVREK